MQIPVIGARGQYKRPGIPRLNLSHPLCQGLVFYGYDVGGQIIDLTVSRPAKLVGTVNPIGSSFAGDGIKYASANGSVYFTQDAAVQLAAPASSACAFVKTGAVGAYSRPWGRTANNGGSSPFSNMDFEINPGSAGQGNISATYNVSGTGHSFTSVASLSDNKFQSVAGTYSTSGTDNRLYANGALVQTDNSGVLTSFNTNADIIFGGSSNAAGANQFVGLVFYGAIWNRVLTPSEILALHLDPFAHLIYPEDDIFAELVGAASSGPTCPKRLALMGVGCWTTPLAWIIKRRQKLMRSKDHDDVQ